MTSVLKLRQLPPHTYMYHRNWKSVLMYYYVFVSVQLFFYSILGQEYASYFAELFEHYYSLGILLAMVQIQFFSPHKHNSRYFHPVSLFKDYSLKNDLSYKKLIYNIEKRLKKSNINSDGMNIVQITCLRYGLWPWRLWFGFGYCNDDNDNNDNGYVCKNTNNEQTISKLQQKKELMDLVHKRWVFRRKYWKQWLQLTSLNMPATIFLTLEGEGPIKAGLLLYGLITTSLLVIYKKINEREYTDVLLHVWDKEMLRSKKKEGDCNCNYNDDISDENVDDDIDCIIQTTKTDHKTNRHLSQNSKIKMLTNINLTVMMNNFDILYTTWIFTCVFLIGFQCIPFLSSFYRVLLSVSIMIITSVFFVFIDLIVKKCVYVKSNADLKRCN